MLYNEFTVILPTLNEADNIGILLKKLISSYKGISIIATDDGSIDKTKYIVLSFHNRRIFFLDRKDKDIHGLTASILDATKIVKSKYFIVMDADTQHPWKTVEEIANNLKYGATLVIASRIKVFGSWRISKKIISYLGNMMAKISLLVRNKKYINYDILSGFFGVEANFWKKVIFEENKFALFRAKGYKILFDFLKVIPNNILVKNVYYSFNARKIGSSKSNIKIYIEFLKALFL